MIIPNNFAPAMLITLFAGLSTAIGGGIAFIVKKDNLKLLVNIQDWTMKVVNLPIDIDEQRFSYGDNKFTNCGELKIK